VANRGSAIVNKPSLAKKYNNSGNGNLDISLHNKRFHDILGVTGSIEGDGSIFGAFRFQNPVFDNGMERWVVSYGATDAVLTATANTPDEASTLLLLMVGFLGLVTYRRRSARKGA